MFVSQSPAATPFGAITTLRIVSIAERAIGLVLDLRRRQQTKTALENLTDSQLADIGLHRGQIPMAVEGLIRH